MWKSVFMLKTLKNVYRASSSDTSPKRQKNEQRLSIRFAIEIEACISEDKAPRPALHYSKDDKPIDEQKEKIISNNLTFLKEKDLSVQCEHGFTNVEYILSDTHKLMFSPDNKENAALLFESCQELWKTENLQNSNTAATHIHVSAFINEPLTTNSHPFLKQALSKVFYEQETISKWQGIPGVYERVNLNPGKQNLNLLPIMDTKYESLPDDERHIHVEIRAMKCFFHILQVTDSSQKFVDYISLIYKLFDDAIKECEQISTWTDSVYNFDSFNLKDEGLAQIVSKLQNNNTENVRIIITNNPNLSNVSDLKELCESKKWTLWDDQYCKSVPDTALFCEEKFTTDF
jgi:hypothetical protein